MSKTERKLANFEFGFADSVDLATRVCDYIAEVQKEFDGDTSWIEGLPDHQQKTVLNLMNSKQEEVEYLEARLLDPEELFNQIKFLYTLAVSLENTGLSSQLLYEHLVEQYEERVMPLIRLIEHGLREQWGYIFAQAFMATRMRKAMKLK